MTSVLERIIEHLIAAWLPAPSGPLEHWTEKDWEAAFKRQVVQSMLEKAAHGDVAAVQWLEEHNYVSLP